jgi:hypothetical protein
MNFESPISIETYQTESLVNDRQWSSNHGLVSLNENEPEYLSIVVSGRTAFGCLHKPSVDTPSGCCRCV